MEPITSWSAERVSGWLKGLDAPLQQYPFEEWQLSGMDLLQLSSQDLERLGVRKIGHQELILEAVEKLCALTYGMGGENLRSLTEKLQAVARSLQMGIQSHWRVNTYDGQSATKLPAKVLQAVLELITAAKGLFSLLNRYQYAQLNGCTASRNIITLCQDLGTTVHKEITVFEKEKDIISICRQLVAVCDEILSSSPESLLNHTAQLESVDLVPAAPGDQLGIEITSTGCSNHYVTGTLAESPAEFCEKILAGDEVIQVNDQIVVGWSRKNLVKKLEENPNGVTLVLKKVPVSLRRKEKQEVEEEEEGEGAGEDKNRHSILERVAASVRSLSFRSAVSGPEARRLMGQEESELSVDQTIDGTQTYTSHPDSQGTDSEDIEKNRLELEVPAERRSPSPHLQHLSRASVSSCPEMAGHKDEKETKKTSTKGTRTAMSRRRVSCRELGRPDCDGWLWKKRKDTSVFTTQKWQRFWFVLKGDALYWYTSQQEEKAEGLVNIGSYSIESAGEHKRKYVFKMCHQRFQNFFFAADNVNDMSKWINCLITAIQKHKKLHHGCPDSEEECYSETESEEEGSHSPRSHKKKVSVKSQANTLPRTKGKKNRHSGGAATPPLTTGGSKVTGAPEDEMGELFHKLKEGGVSLIGQKQPLTHDQLRRSFIRRNKNPVINEKILTLRALQSTLKAKEAELLLINKILDDSELTPGKFRQWKQCNEDLYLEIVKLAAEKERAQAAAAEEKVAMETIGGSDGACALSLSEGEQLVDAELPVPHGDTDVSHPQTEPETQPLVTQTASQTTNTAYGSSENYFYI
ncbi:connector enhancer of kinase suppressor of ras 1 [Chanos chanos]|uniref:Connector enhancer of kinase suppressor of ras 1 n=1 Tax=Chanos chanos TaxID=29144 RepID=A0A6J2WFY4_CHACN|nr:connector enhancer of kinase suppressor of ras 1 [Chanos chanos]